MVHNLLFKQVNNQYISLNLNNLLSYGILSVHDLVIGFGATKV